MDDEAEEITIPYTRNLPWLPRESRACVHAARLPARGDLNNARLTLGKYFKTVQHIVKTSAPDIEQPVLNLPYFQDNPNICPASAISEYLTATQSLRNNIENLLLTYKKPHKAASSQTISRWIKQVLSESGVDISVFRAHSARHAATSAARRAGVSVDAIRKTAGWTMSSNAFARFYNRPIVNNDDFARSVCLNSNR
ncbi:unnamed protein product [Plutella xylostella]|uniref:(diamondback moth) hypothetical protein n=1 Tax=Plutella xylostella TaxID=51655 RepID=A0A8S4GCL3_PLUXY|nr:unnamed protein product [Plutella xylostella]